ncbi:hypothetical protein IFU39_00255 [Paenibacillus sp. CFBP 13594]|uniref:hypothetical protein n=1 Tax=Paenibacillus sp. CFBP 13594 TaxID=2774037 RepID=UPI00177C3134|nr:hypothetical protein [Paenibacillus sp. CFBP 13594]MBD8836250.1 hypothetical protein [Paenibacillus sp. CFBP 13594]
MDSKLSLNRIETAQLLTDEWNKLSDKEKNNEYAVWVEDLITNGKYVIELGQYGVQDTYLIPDYISIKGHDQCWSEIHGEWIKRQR